MATYEVYLGGPRQQNASWAMFPAAAFVADAVVQPMVKQKPIAVTVVRKLAFGSEPSLQRYVADLNAAGTPIVSGDKLGAVIVPANFLAVGFYWHVVGVNAGGTFAAGTRIGAVSLLTATTTGTANSGYVAWPAGPVLFKTSDMVDITLGTVPAGGLGTLDLRVSVVGFDLSREGNY